MRRGFMACPSLLESTEHIVPCMALSAVWGEILNDTIRQIFTLSHTQCLPHLQNKARSYTQLDINQEFMRKL